MDKKSVTARELAERFEVSVRTILRDVDTLCASGIPLCTTQGKGGGISLMDGFVLDKSVLTESEQEDILSALHSLYAASAPDAEPVLDKLASLFKKNTVAWIDIDFSPWEGGAGEREKFYMLKDAILSKKLVSFDYYSYWGERSRRTVEPLQIVFRERAWYLSAFCPERNDYRTFKLSRIKRPELTEKNFIERPYVRVSGSFHRQNLCEVTLRVEEEAAHRIWEDFSPEQIEENADGSFTVKAVMPDDEWGYSYILTYGEYAEVLAPQHIRDYIAKKFAAATNKYLKHDTQ